MVSSGKRVHTIAVVIVAALCLIVLLAVAATAQEDAEPTIEEEYAVVLNEVGDGRVTDTIRYSREDYSVIKNVEGESRGFLTRRLTTDDNIGEMVDFKTDLDDENRSVVITYDKPGFAYNDQGEFAVYGFSEKPQSTSGGVFTFESESTINSEFTLFTDQVISTRTTIDLPDEASDPRYDATDKAIKYRMPPAETMLGFWSENKSLMSIIFGVLAVAFAVLLVFVATRPTAAPLPAGVAPAPVMPPPTAAGTPIGGATQEAAPEAPGPGPGKTPRFCRKCGNELAAGRKFCTKCGTSV